MSFRLGVSSIVRRSLLPIEARQSTCLQVPIETFLKQHREHSALVFSHPAWVLYPDTVLHAAASLGDARFMQMASQYGAMDWSGAMLCASIHGHGHAIYLAWSRGATNYESCFAVTAYHGHHTCLQMEWTRFPHSTRQTNLATAFLAAAAANRSPILAQLWIWALESDLDASIPWDHAIVCARKAHSHDAHDWLLRIHP